MEIAQLKSFNQQCPAGTLPFYHSFGQRFACVPEETQGLSGNLGVAPNNCPGGTPALQFGGKIVCFRNMPGGFGGTGLGCAGGMMSLVKLALAFGAGYFVAKKF